MAYKAIKGRQADFPANAQAWWGFLSQHKSSVRGALFGGVAAAYKTTRTGERRQEHAADVNARGNR